MAGLLDGKIALVTGGAAGIGEGAVRALAAEGAAVAICDRDRPKGEALADELNGAGGRALFVEADYLNPDAARGAVQAALAYFGALDIVVNNVGGTSLRPLSDQSANSIERVLNLNLISLLATTQEAAKSLRAGGAIVNVASTEALRAAPGFAVYSAAKAAMAQFTKTMALELAPRGVRVNCIAPDHIATPGLAGLMDRDAVDRDRHVPLGRLAGIEEAGAVICFLASPKASWVTGVTIPVDGGITAASGWRHAEGGGWEI